MPGDRHSEDRQDVETKAACHELRPQEVRARPWHLRRLGAGIRRRARQDRFRRHRAAEPRTPRGPRPEDAVVEHQIDARPRGQRRQPFEQFEGSNSRCVVPSLQRPSISLRAA
jgi:hypothetical protein